MLNYPGFERGEAFEKFAFGRDIDSIEDALEVIKEFNKKREEEQGVNRASGAISMSNQFGDLSQGKYVWNGSGWNIEETKKKNEKEKEK